MAESRRVVVGGCALCGALSRVVVMACNDELREALDRIVDLRVCLKGVMQQRDALRAAVRDLAARFYAIAEEGFANGSALAPAYEDAGDRVIELVREE